MCLKIDPFISVRLYDPCSVIWLFYRELIPSLTINSVVTRLIEKGPRSVFNWWNNKWLMLPLTKCDCFINGFFPYDTQETFALIQLSYISAICDVQLHLDLQLISWRQLQKECLITCLRHTISYVVDLRCRKKTVGNGILGLLFRYDQWRHVTDWPSIWWYCFSVNDDWSKNMDLIA